MMEEQMLYFPLTKRFQAKDLIRSFVTYMADRVHKDRPIDTFILLIDEASKMEEYILQRYPRGAETTGCARAALLNEDIAYDGGALRIALEISCISVDSIHGPYSNRAVQALVLPSKLNKTATVTEIWNKGNRLHVSPEHEHRLELIAATVNNNSRLVEIVRDYIKAKQTDSLIVDREFVEGLYEHLDSQIELRYPMTFDCPSDQVLRALILGDDVALDSETESCIACSIITSSLDCFYKKGILQEPGTFLAMKPEMSFAMMRYVTSKGRTDLARAISSGMTAIVDVVTVDESKGHIWGKALSEWVKIRLAVMCKYVPDKNVRSYGKVMNIMKLFGITRDDSVPYMHWKMLSAPLGFPDVGDTYWTEHHLTNDSCKETNSFLKEIDNIKLTASCPVAIVFPAEQEAWDLCLKILVPGYKKPIHIFVENKAAEESLDSADRVPFDVSNSKRIAREELEGGGSAGGGEQQTHTEMVMGDRKIVYIHVKTHDTVSSRIDNATELGRYACIRFLGPSIDFY